MRREWRRWNSSTSVEKEKEERWERLRAFVCFSIFFCGGSTLKTIAVIGDDAERQPVISGGGSGGVIPPFIVTPLAAITERATKE